MLMNNRDLDMRRLIGEVKKFFKFDGFDWQRRYDAVYVCRYARTHKWNQSRLRAAIDTLDLRWRIAVNHQRAKNEEGR